MNKHVESLPKVDKPITFHYCTVTFNVLWFIGVIFFEKTTQIVFDFLRFKFF